MMKRQRGFALVELLITVAITGLIITFLGTAVYQIFNATEYGNRRMLATHELRNAAHWVCLDGQMASIASGGNELVLTLPDDSSIIYALVGSELHRIAGKSQMILARNISSLSFSVENRIITMTVTSSPEGRLNVSEKGTYKVCLRPTEKEE